MELLRLLDMEKKKNARLWKRIDEFADVVHAAEDILGATNKYAQQKAISALAVKLGEFQAKEE